MPFLPHARDQRIGLCRRSGRRVTIREIAERISITPSYLSEIETQRRSASREVTALLADVYGCTSEDLTGGKKDRPKGPPIEKPKSSPKRDTSPPNRRNDTRSPNRHNSEAVA